jgi:AraC-like DNA-binding protein
LAVHNWVTASPTGPLFHSALTTPLGRVTWAGRHLDLEVRGSMAMRYWDTYAAEYVLKGRARFHDADGLSLAVGPGDLVLTFPRHGYRYVFPPRQLWSECFVQFRGPLFGLWVKEGLLSPKRPVHHLEPIDHWWKRLEAIIKPLALPEPAQSLKRVGLLQDFLVDAVIAPQAAATPQDVAWLATAQAWLERDYDQPPDWDAVARRLDLSYHRFRKKFVALSGVPPAHYRAARIIEHAENLLHNRRLSIREIARQCGFCDEFHFAKRFRQVTGLTPAQLRRRLL